ncbi:uncharacterized protein LOC134852682 [Symsagittifera roscoffensis]|uniref:uncharacterized protein LOC134852682 n=1 Tax=Symsagittifera roscoffensis TaxID=84072 RepID=UPI00307BE52B
MPAPGAVEADHCHTNLSSNPEADWSQRSENSVFELSNSNSMSSSSQQQSSSLTASVRPMSDEAAQESEMRRATATTQEQTQQTQTASQATVIPIVTSSSSSNRNRQSGTASGRRINAATNRERTVDPNSEIIDMSMEIILNLTTCGICLDIFRDPKSLPCLHSFCKRCLMTLTQNDNTLPFPCPTCRRLCGSTVSTLPDDFKSKILVDTVRQRESNRGGRVGGGVVIHPESAATQSRQPVLCQAHGSRRCEFFCEECNIPICVRCTNAEHVDHCYIDVFEDAHVLIDDLDYIVENVKRDVQRLEENNTDIEIMMCEFSYLMDERVKKLKKMVDQTASQVKAGYSQELLSAQTDVRRQTIMHLSFIQKTNDYLNSLKESVRDCAMFEIYADAKMHLTSSNTRTPNFLLQRPAKFEFAPCVEYQVMSALTQFFGQPGSVPEPPNVMNQLCLSSTPSPNGTGSNSLHPPGLSPTPETSSSRDYLLSTSATGAHGAIGGARRKRQYNPPAVGQRRNSPAVEALFSSAANASSSSSPLHFPEAFVASSSSQSDFAAGSNQESASGVSILRSILPQTAITVTSSEDAANRSTAVTHPLTPFFMASFRSYNQNNAAASSPADVHSAASTNDVQVPLIDLVSSNRNLQISRQSQVQGARVMEPQDVQQFFQSLLGTESRQTSQESVLGTGSEVSSDVSEQQRSNHQAPNAESGEILTLFPEMSVSAFPGDQTANESSSEEEEETPESQRGSADIAEETL